MPDAIVPTFLFDRNQPFPNGIREDVVLQDTVRWLERAVIGLNLCPFAKGVHVKGQVHYVVSQATEPQALLDDLRRELLALARNLVPKSAIPPC